MTAAWEDGILAIDLPSPGDTDRLGRALAGLAEPGMVLALVGNLGAGKTHLARAIATGLDVPAESISSPTFVLIHEYEGRLPVAHFDTYRLPTAEQFEALAPWEYFDGEGLSIVEWADRVADLIPPRAWWLRFELAGPSGRRVRIETPDEAGLRRLAATLAAF